MLSKKLPRCSLPGEVKDRKVSGDILNLHNCALGRWCESAGQEKIGKKKDFQELQRIHAQLHWIAQEIVWYDDISGSGIGIIAMEHFNDLWQQLLRKIKKIVTTLPLIYFASQSHLNGNQRVDTFATHCLQIT